jgi:molybdenum-dependent DNA-binding transcriptional regulator ModE
MNAYSVKAAIEKGGSIRQGARLLGKSYTALQWWLARNGYEVVKVATIRPIRRGAQRLEESEPVGRFEDMPTQEGQP